jgi:hypothetical protein
MLELYDEAKVLNLTVIRQNSSFPLGLNKEEVEAEKVNDARLSIDRHGVTYISEDEGVYPVTMDYSDVIYLEHNRVATWIKEKGKQPMKLLLLRPSIMKKT